VGMRRGRTWDSFLSMSMPAGANSCKNEEAALALRLVLVEAGRV
jgi:hypothetical protein